MQESGVALLISLFALLLICVVGVALIMASGTNSALTGNYHSATSVYYAALAGLEEARGRLQPKSPNYFDAVTPFIPQVPGEVRYILNPLPGETVAPWDQGNPATFPDTEYRQEFGVDPPGPTQSAPSVSSASGVQGQVYKWVRINPVTATSMQTMGVNVKQGAGSALTQVLYANNGLTLDAPGAPVLEVTALAAMPNGSQRMLQYIVAPITFNLSFPAALTLMGTTTATFAGPGSTPPMSVDGTNTIVIPGVCSPGATPPVAGIGVGGGAGLGNISGANVLPLPGAQQVTVAANLQTVANLETLAQTIETSADVFRVGPQTQAILPPTMSPTNPVTIAVDGDLDLSTWTGTGYGVLLVTGTLRYDPSSTWNGIVLVIGQGKVISTAAGGGSIYGAALVAQTRDAGGNTLPSLGAASWQASGGTTINYSSCWVNKVQSTISYKVLSFREIPQNTP